MSGMTSYEFLDKVIRATPDGEHIRKCLQCGTCSGICPYGFAMDHPPRSLIAALRADDWHGVLESDTIWLCVSCFACASVCPVKIPLTRGLLSTLKTEMLVGGSIPQELQTALGNSRRYGNALGESPRKRADWTKDFATPVPVMASHKEPVDALWFVGDYGSYHPRVQLVSKAMANVLQALGVSFGILGPEENSDGDTQAFTGEWGLFELLARKNIKAMTKYSFDEVITTDPHAFNALKHEYPRLGFERTVKHHTQFLLERVEQLKALFKNPLAMRVTYHDPCYLGRANENNVYEEPRQLLAAIPGVELVEMAHNRALSLCCGGGGGGMWLDGFSWEKAHARTTEWRIKEAIAVGADVLAVACPYETPRFEDAVKSTGNEGKLRVRDIAELLAEAMFG
jgi:dimethylglycine catabolism B